MKTKEDLNKALADRQQKNREIHKEMMDLFMRFVFSLKENGGFEEGDFKYISQKSSNGTTLFEATPRGAVFLDEDNLVGNFRFSILNLAFWIEAVKGKEGWIMGNKFSQNRSVQIKNWDRDNMKIFVDSFTEDLHNALSQDPPIQFLNDYNYVKFK